MPNSSAITYGTARHSIEPRSPGLQLDGSPILLVAVPPAVMLLLGRLEVLDEGVSLWASLFVAVVQLVGIGAYVGSVGVRGTNTWIFAAATAAVGLGVVTLKLVLGH